MCFLHSVCACANGHLPVVLYLLTKCQADPLVRNRFGETAFDVCAGVFEVFICEALEQFEADRWPEPSVPKVEPYNVLAVHTSVPVTVYENQRFVFSFSPLQTFPPTHHPLFRFQIGHSIKDTSDVVRSTQVLVLLSEKERSPTAMGVQDPDGLERKCSGRSGLRGERPRPASV